MTRGRLDPLSTAARVGAILESLGLEYSVGGSLASAFSGEPRSTLDIDIVVALGPDDVKPLAAALGDGFYVDGEALARAARTRSAANLIELETSTKIDLFVAGGTALDDALLRRRLRISVGSPPATLYVHTPEDILLQKLRWYRQGGEVSDRQWRDVLGIVRVQGKRLDRDYLEAGALQLTVSDLLTDALRQAVRGTE